MIGIIVGLIVVGGITFAAFKYVKSRCEKEVKIIENVRYPESGKSTIEREYEFVNSRESRVEVKGESEERRELPMDASFKSSTDKGRVEGEFQTGERVESSDECLPEIPEVEKLD